MYVYVCYVCMWHSSIVYIFFWLHKKERKKIWIPLKGEERDTQRDGKIDTLEEPNSFLVSFQRAMVCSLSLLPLFFCSDMYKVLYGKGKYKVQFPIIFSILFFPFFVCLSVVLLFYFNFFFFVLAESVVGGQHLNNKAVSSC